MHNFPSLARITLYFDYTGKTTTVPEIAFPKSLKSVQTPNIAK
jgi:hypothetical protein